MQSHKLRYIKSTDWMSRVNWLRRERELLCATHINDDETRSDILIIDKRNKNSIQRAVSCLSRAASRNGDNDDKVNLPAGR